VIEETHNRGCLFQLRFELGNERHRLGVEIVQIEDHQSGSFGFGRIGQSRDDFFLALDELNLHAELARRLLNLRLEEQIVDEAEDPGRGVFANGYRGGRLVRVEVLAAAVTTARAEEPGAPIVPKGSRRILLSCKLGMIAKEDEGKKKLNINDRLKMAADAGFEHAIQLRQNLLEIMRRHYATQFLGGLMMRHREVVISRGKPFWLLFRHHLLPVHKKSEMRLGKPLRAFEILFNDGRDNGLDGLQVLQHDGPMLTARLGGYRDRDPGIGKVYYVLIRSRNILSRRTSP